MAYYLEYRGLKVRLLRGQWWLCWADGLTMGRWLCFRSKRPSPYLIAHETWHASSFRLHGFWAFLWHYCTNANFRAHEEEAAHDFGERNGWSEPFLSAAKLFGWTP